MVDVRTSGDSSCALSHHYKSYVMITFSCALSCMAMLCVILRHSMNVHGDTRSSDRWEGRDLCSSSTVVRWTCAASVLTASSWVAGMANREYHNEVCVCCAGTVRFILTCIHPILPVRLTGLLPQLQSNVPICLLRPREIVINVSTGATEGHKGGSH